MTTTLDSVLSYSPRTARSLRVETDDRVGVDLHFGSLGRAALGLWVLQYAVASLRHFYGDGWIRTLFNVFLLIILNAVVVTPILFATVATRIM